MYSASFLLEASRDLDVSGVFELNRPCCSRLDPTVKTKNMSNVVSLVGKGTACSV